MHPDERTEWLKVVGATLVATLLPVLLWASWARSPGADANAASSPTPPMVTWNTRRCDTVRHMLNTGVPTADLALALADADLTPLDVQCLTHPTMPDVVQLAALERIVLTYPRFGPALSRKRMELARRR